MSCAKLSNLSWLLSAFERMLNIITLRVMRLILHLRAMGIDHGDAGDKFPQNLE